MCIIDTVKGATSELKAKLMDQLFALAQLKSMLQEFHRRSASRAPSLTTKVLTTYVYLLRFLIFEGLGMHALAAKGARELVACLAQKGRVTVALVMSEIGNLRALPDIMATLARCLLGAADYASIYLLLHAIHPLRNEILWARMQYLKLLHALHLHFSRTPSPSASSLPSPLPTTSSFLSSPSSSSSSSPPSEDAVSPPPNSPEASSSWENLLPASVLQSLGLDAAGFQPDPRYPEPLPECDDALQEIARWLED
jgi:hypothetical protein